MIKVSSLCKSFITPVETVIAVDQVDLEVKAGELVCLYGPSGSGKSTLINLLAGIETADSGSIWFGDTDFTGLSDAEREQFRISGIGLIFQDGNLFAEFSAVENVFLPLLAQGVDKSEARERALTALGRFGIGDLADRFPQEMSGGQRQRVGVARAFAADQSVLLADEPTGSLDRSNSLALLEQFASLAHELGKAVLVATHDPLAEQVADRVLWMQDGQFVGRDSK